MLWISIFPCPFLTNYSNSPRSYCDSSCLICLKCIRPRRSIYSFASLRCHMSKSGGAANCATCNVQHKLNLCLYYAFLICSCADFAVPALLLLLLLLPSSHLICLQLPNVFDLCRLGSRIIACSWWHSPVCNAHQAPRTAHAICCNVAVAVASPDQLPAEGGAGRCGAGQKQL